MPAWILNDDQDGEAQFEEVDEIDQEQQQIDHEKAANKQAEEALLQRKQALKAICAKRPKRARAPMHRRK